MPHYNIKMKDMFLLNNLYKYLICCIVSFVLKLIFSMQTSELLPTWMRIILQVTPACEFYIGLLQSISVFMVHIIEVSEEIYSHGSS
jgi:hypothetical protein